VGLIAHVDGHLGIDVLTDQILTDDDHHHAGRAYILLHTGVDHAIVGDIAGLGEEHGGLVGHQDMALGIGELIPGDAVDGLILADVDIVGILGNVQVGAVGNIAEILILGGGGHNDLTVLLSLGNGLLGPGTGLYIHSLAVLHQVPGNGGELQGGTALDEQDLVVIGNVHQLTQVGLGLVDDLLEHLGAVAHLHDAHTAAAVVHHLVTDLLQDGLRHHGRTGGKVKSAVILHFDSTSCLCNVIGDLRFIQI